MISFAGIAAAFSSHGVRAGDDIGQHEVEHSVRCPIQLAVSYHVCDVIIGLLYQHPDCSAVT